jgi:hypothetical protein
VVHPDLQGPGGGVDGAGRSYFFSRARADRHDLAELDLASAEVRTVAEAAPGGYFGAPRPAPDGRRLVATYWDVHQAALVVVDRRSGRRLVSVPEPAGLVLDARWIDDHRVVYTAASGGRPQVFVRDLDTGASRQLTAAPYLAAAPQPGPGGRLRFLDRHGWRWSVDEIPWPAALAPRLIPARYEQPVRATQLPEPEVAVLSDRPYSGWERLFFPRLRTVAFEGITDQAGHQHALLSAALGGADRLSYHSWALSGGLDLATRQASFDFGYTNRQLAPLTISAEVAQRAWTEDIGDTVVTATDRLDRAAQIRLTREFYTHDASLGFRVEEDRLGQRQRKLGGPTAALSLAAWDGTPYAGSRRGLFVDASAAYYPRALTSTSDSFANLGGTLTALLPVPGLARPRLSLDLGGRAIVGLPAGHGLLQLGGLGGAAFHSSTRPEPRDPPPNGALPDLPDGFFQRLRGYEYHAFTVDRVAVANASLRYPFIVDRGWASSLGLFPSFFVRQLDLEPFASAAWDTVGTDRSHFHAAAGGAVHLELAWLLPFTLSYQVSRRLLDDLATVHLVEFTASTP